jgi:formylglycine-generating enzyme required for sulfatase activity
LFDLTGNLWEWQANYVDQDHDWLGLRGGSWYDNGEIARVAIRLWFHPAYRWLNRGFRPLAVPQGMPL